MSTRATSTRRLTRGVRNNNPGNIRRAKGVTWQGALELDPSDPRFDPDFEVYRTPEMGVRAIVRTLLTYYVHHHLKTVRQIITRWAPPEDHNNTAAYVSAVADECGVHPDQTLNVDSFAVMRGLVVGIIAHENAGYRYPAAVIDEALRLGGVADAPRPKLAKSPEVQGAVVSAAASGATGAIALAKSAADTAGALASHAPPPPPAAAPASAPSGPASPPAPRAAQVDTAATLQALQGAREQIAPVAQYSQAAVSALLVLAFIGAGVVMWAQYRKARRL